MLVVRIRVIVGCLFVSLLALTSQSAGSEEISSLAIMNFTNRSVSGEWQWLSKGLADMLITDLSNCKELQVVERERMQKLFEEMTLSTTGLLDGATAVQFGKVAKVDKALFGSFLKEGDRLEIEAHLIEVATGEMVRVEWVRGKAEDVFKLEKELAFKIIKNLHVKVTKEERENIRYLPTDSIDAVTHFYTGLDYYDKGEYTEAFAEIRGAVKKDQSYGQARYWVGQMYLHLGELEHALIEHIRFVEEESANPWAGNSQFAIGKIYDKYLSMPLEAINAYEKLITGYPESRDTALADYRIGQLAEKQGELVKAYEAYRTVDSFVRKAGYKAWVFPAPVWHDNLRIYHKILREFGPIVDPPISLQFLSVDEPGFRIKVEKDEKWDSRQIIDSRYFAAPEGYQIDSVDIYITGECDLGVHGSYFQMSVACPSPYHFDDPFAGIYIMHGESVFPPNLPYPPLKKEGKTFSRHVGLPQGTALFRINLSRQKAATVYEWGFDAKISPYELKPQTKMPDTRPEIPADRECKTWIVEDYNAKMMKWVIMERTIVGVFKISEGGAFNPFMIQDRGGKFWIVYNDSDCVRFLDIPGYNIAGTDADIWLSWSTDGVTWQIPERLPVNSTANDFWPCMIEDESGNLWLVWVKQGEEKPVVMISSSSDGEKWSYPYKIVPDGQTKNNIAPMFSPRLIQDREGVFWLAYHVAGYTIEGVNYPASIFISNSMDCRHWEKPTLVSNKSVDGVIGKYILSLIQDSDGVYRIAWVSDTKDIYISSSRDGKRWETKKTDVPDPTRSWWKVDNTTTPTLIENSEGKYCLSLVPSGLSPMFAVSSDCKSWSKPYHLLFGWPNEVRDRTGSTFLQDKQGWYWMAYAKKAEHDSQSSSPAIYIGTIPLFSADEDLTVYNTKEIELNP